MEKERIQNLLDSWNGYFTEYPLTTADLKNPHALMTSMIRVFDRLGIDMEAVLAPPPEEARNESTTYYWDLLPVINITRVINHILSGTPQTSEIISITHILQPTPDASYYILVLPFNLMLFNEERLRDIASQEEELFGKTNMIKTLEDKKNKLLTMLNEQAQEKGKRADRMEKLDIEIKQLEEELKQEKEMHDEEKQELDSILKENQQTEMLIEQKKNQRDAIIAELNRKESLRVYDADEIRAQVDQASQNVQEAEEKLESLRASLMHKENSLKNLQTLKPSLDTANNLLHELMKLSESLKELECGDLNSESAEGEVELLNIEVCELRSTLSEMMGARADQAVQASAAAAHRDKEKTIALGALREAEEKDKKCRERCKRSSQRIDELKELTVKYEQDKAAGFEQILAIKSAFCNELKSAEDKLLMKLVEVEKTVKEKLQDHNV